ncbi:ABC transporter permease [Planctomicrobium sp. SH668]|uniref:ABC transporter permease n=1 Tax=Planctomicrobium sp. SH668 TaxID=3448126 RepID=UPI003F5BD53C
MLKFALGNLLSRSLRSLLALFGLAIAIAGMVVLFSIAQGIDDVVRRSFSQIPGLAVQQAGAPLPIFSNLPAAWAKEIETLPGVNVVDSEVVQRLNLIEGKLTLAPPRFLVGVDLRQRPKLLKDVYRDHLRKGRYFTEADEGSNHCIISQQIADETGRGVGDVVLLNETPATVIGIYETGSVLLDVNILLDNHLVRKMMRISDDTVSFFYVEPIDGTDQKLLKQQIETLFRGRSTVTTPRGGSGWSILGQKLVNQFLTGVISLENSGAEKTSPEKFDASDTRSTAEAGTAPSNDVPSTIEVRLAEDWSSKFSEFTGDLELFLSLISIMAVAIAVLSIVNTMSMSVTERMTEFGILRANGWSKWNVVQLMTLESSILGLAGGLVGASLGWGATQVFNAIWTDRLQLLATPQLLVFSIVASTVLGVLGGVYPAWVAASRSPMDAIRRG